MRTTELARNRWAGILQQFGVASKHLQNKHTSCPICGGKDRYRFDNKDGNGTWFCNHCGSGNGFDLVMRITGQSFKDVATQIDKIAGNVIEVKPMPKRDPVEYLRKIYKQSTPNIKNTPVDKYLQSRGLTVDNVQNVRYCAALAYYENGKILGKYPAMIARFDDVEGNAATLHATYLTTKGEKAPVDSVRKTLPKVKQLSGGAVRLGKIEQTLYVAEGIETALSVAKMYNVPCWAALNATLLEQFQPPKGVKQVVICADNDKNYRGQKAAMTLAHLLSNKGYQVSVVWPEIVGNDWNDELKKG